MFGQSAGYQSTPSEERITTLVIQNIPDEYTQDELIQEVSEALGSNSFDFFYLPWDERNGTNAGYALVNLTDQRAMQLAPQILSNYFFRRHNNGPARIFGHVAAAQIQGLKSLIWQFQDIALEGQRNGPIVAWNGHHIELTAVFQQLKVQSDGTDTPALSEVPNRAIVSGGPQHVAACGSSMGGLETDTVPPYLPAAAAAPVVHPQIMRVHTDFPQESLGMQLTGESFPHQSNKELQQPPPLLAAPATAHRRPAAAAAHTSDLSIEGPLIESPPGLRCADVRGNGDFLASLQAPRDYASSNGAEARVVEITVPSAHEDALRKFTLKFGHSL